MEQFSQKSLENISNKFLIKKKNLSDKIGKKSIIGVINQKTDSNNQQPL